MAAASQVLSSQLLAFRVVAPGVGAAAAGVGAAPLCTVHEVHEVPAAVCCVLRCAVCWGVLL